MEVADGVLGEAGINPNDMEVSRSTQRGRAATKGNTNSNSSRGYTRIWRMNADLQKYFSNPRNPLHQR
jgi:hypothetical protein